MQRELERLFALAVPTVVREPVPTRSQICTPCILSQTCTQRMHLTQRFSQRRTVSYTHLGAEYRIVIENPYGAEHGVQELYVDGVRQERNLLAPAVPGRVVSVRVVLGG